MPGPRFLPSVQPPARWDRTADSAVFPRGQLTACGADRSPTLQLVDWSLRTCGRRGHITYAPTEAGAARAPACRDPGRRGVAVPALRRLRHRRSTRRRACGKRADGLARPRVARRVRAAACSRPSGSFAGSSSARLIRRPALLAQRELAARALRERPAGRQAARQRLWLQPRQLVGRARDPQAAAHQALDTASHRDPARGLRGASSCAKRSACGC